MRKIFGIAGLVAAAIYVFAQSGGGVLGAFTKKINEAKSLEAIYIYQRVGGGKLDISVQLSKPNLAKIDRPNELVVADGKNITTYDKVNNTFYARPQTDAELASILSSDDVSIWLPFFSRDVYAKVPSKTLPAKNRKGMILTPVEMSVDASNKKIVTLHIAQDSVARQAEIVFNDPNGRQTFVIDTKSVNLDGVSSDAFAFKAPEGARKLTMDEIDGARWYTDIDEAMKAASRSNRKIFIDFMATWCGPCKMLDAEVLSTDGFKKLSNKLVFLRIDVDAQPAVAQKYGITAMPTQMVADKDGNVLAKTIGYGGAGAFYSWLNGALK